MTPKPRTLWRCQSCGAAAPRWLGRCNECGEFATLVEELEEPPVARASGNRPAAEAMSLAQIGDERVERVSAGIPELDRALGGGLVCGSLVLLGGEPGIGKSTLLLQLADKVAAAGSDVVYVCGEESPQQIGLRAKRIGATSDRVQLLPELDMALIERFVSEQGPDVLIVDSVQTTFDPDLGGAPGSVGQVRACTSRLMRMAKDAGITTLLAGHVTKDGAIAGPRVLEHMVDTVLYFEGDRDHAFRLVRAVKNRFGSSSEIGIFQMTEKGLLGVETPSAMLLAERGEPVPGSVAMPTMEGTRPLMVEIQALVTPSYLPAPRRLATGLDTARLLQVISVLERRAQISFSGLDVLASVAGGVRVNEPAVDLPLALALGSAVRDVPVPLEMAAFGEIGLTGHIRQVSQSEARIREAERLGFTRVLACVGNRVSGKSAHPVETVGAALGAIAG